MRFEFDLSAAPVLKPVDDGVYLLQVVNCKDKVNDKGNTELMFEFKIIEPKELEVDGARVETLYIPFYISKDDPRKSLGFLRPLWEACGKLVPGQPYFDPSDIYGDIFGAEIAKQAGTAEYPNPKNVFRNYFKQNDCPPVGPKPPKD